VGATAESIQSEYDTAFQKVLSFQQEVAHIHPILERHFPIALVEDDQFYVFDIDASGRRYEFVKRAPTGMPIPPGVRAAFPLDCYDGRLACVVSGDVFDALGGYATILHEFVHCYQGETCESSLKDTLGIARKAKAEGDYMWELEYPFPYDDPRFTEAYTAFLVALQDSHDDDVLTARGRLASMLDDGDVEYMIWQEWKEGFARYVENRVKRELGLEENHGGSEPPFSRVSFYEGGSRYIAFLGERDPSLLIDLEALFSQMRDGG
jgi:hypothetical protein